MTQICVDKGTDLCHYVFDTNTAADLTIMEEGTELLNRIKNGGKLPLITSCSPGWIKFCEHNFPDFLDNLSTCKSPHEMFGAVMKTYYAKKEGGLENLHGILYNESKESAALLSMIATKLNCV